MNLIPRNNDRIRIENWDKNVFSDINISNGQDVLELQFNDMHNLQLREKSGTYKMFVIPFGHSASDVDFGWYENGNIIWEHWRIEK